MTNKPLSQLTSGSAVSSTDLFPDIQTAGAGPVKVTAAQIGDYVLSGSGLTGTLPVARGGTGLSSLTAGYIPFGAGTSAFGSSANLFWDNTNTRLAVGGNPPSLGTVNAVSSSGNIALAISDNTTSSLYIRPASGGAIIGTDGGGTIRFATSGNTNTQERMRIDASGRVGIGATALGGYGVRLSSQITGSVFSYGYYLDSSNAADVTNTYIGFGTYLPTANAVTALRHFSASQNTLTGAVTNQYGFYAANDIIGATNNYGFYSNIASGTGRWNFYANGTAQNYFAGNTGFGIVPSTTSRLRVSNDRASISYAQTWSTFNGATFENDVTLGYNGSAAFFGNFQANPLIFLTNNAERMRIDSSGNVGIGVVPTSLQLDIGGNTSPTVRCISTTGSVDMRLQSIGASGVGIVGTYSNSPVVFYTNANERMRIDGSGRVGIGGIANATNDINIAGNATGNVTQYGVLYQKTTQSDVTGVQCGFTTSLSTAAAAFTLTDFRHFFAGFNTIGAGSTVTNQYGFLASNLTGATYNYGFFSNIASGTGRWNFYAAGTADNYFAGRVGIGITNPGNKLNVYFSDNTYNEGIYVANSATGTGSWARVGLGTNGYYSFIGLSNAADFYVFNNSSGPVVLGTNATERMRIDSSGNVLIGTTTSGASKLTVADDSIQINTAKTPASATATGTTGQVCWDASYIYVCTATNTWKRAAIATW